MSAGMDRGAERLPQPGDVLARKYRVVRQLGLGGMGAVFEVEPVDLPGTRVALKVMLPSLAANPDFRARFAREARASLRLTSDHVARVYEVAELDDGTPFMVMELLEGDNFDRIIRARYPLGVSEVVGWIIEGCDAIAEAHLHGLVHRDLKPSNLFLAKQPGGADVVKVLDFGISKTMHLQEGATDVSTLTNTGAPLGSPQYMSPEQFKNSRNVDLRTDIWAFGMVLHRMLTGRFAFEADSLASHLMMIVVEPAIPLRKRRPDAPAELEGVILRCLEKDPNRRYQSVGELARALSPFGPPGCDALVARIVERLGETNAPIPSLAADTAPTSVLVRGAVAMPPGDLATQSAWTPTNDRRGKSTGNVKLKIAVAALAVSVAGLVVALRLVSSGPSAEPAASSVAAAASPGAPSAAATAVADVELRLHVDPPGAVVELDGVVVKDNPLRIPRAGEPRTLRVSAPGHATTERTFEPTRDRDLDIVLKKDEARASPPRRAAPGAPAHPGPAATQAAPARKVKGPLETNL